MSGVEQFFSQGISFFSIAKILCQFLHYSFVMTEITILHASAKVAFIVKPMPSLRLHDGLLMTLFFLSSCLGSEATDLATSGEFPLNDPNGSSSLPTPSVMALPVTPPNNSTTNSASLPRDSGTTRKFYTITAELRETYDDNVNTTKDNKISSFETSLTPSILVDFPSSDSDFSARYTLGITDYSRGGNGNEGNSNGGSIDITHEVLAQYQHSFSDRFSLNLAEQFRYYTEPSIYESTGTPYSNGAYVSNTLNGVLSSQWTPLFSTTTTYANTVIRYDDSNIAQEQDYVENTGSQSFNYAVLPKVVASLGTIIDDIDYQNSARGYLNYTLFLGGQWQILPSLSAIVRGGGSYTEADQTPGSFSPYADVEAYWTLGQRSQLSFVYTHEVTPTDQFGADGQIADRVSTSFNYLVTPDITAFLQGIYTYAQVSNTLIVGGTIPSYDESDYGLNIGASYQYNHYLDFEGGIAVYGVSSGLSSRDYNRNQVYVGVRGTY